MKIRVLSLVIKARVNGRLLDCSISVRVPSLVYPNDKERDITRLGYYCSCFQSNKLGIDKNNDWTAFVLRRYIAANNIFHTDYKRSPDHCIIGLFPKLTPVVTHLSSVIKTQISWSVLEILAEDLSRYARLDMLVSCFRNV
jgi:hypothetical protein